ncbi:Rpn family recombination-promoting nuclease/putative transposase [Serratia fonticola]|nr:Rpn family recombination-promoting nuclease/putative transposase [Serratia fonticola]NXZ89803.1 Rpn family recombination-promoting nuclease/putative transposase [Serratia fonticola]QCR60946.1 Rpn family recombination-promoting nuclease/putative transposase [Serratia fonticola]
MNGLLFPLMILNNIVDKLSAAGSTTKPERLLRELARRAPQHEEELMTIAEYLEQKGFDKGIEKGIEEGRKEGREAILKIALSMLAKGFDHAMVIQLTGLSEEELVQIRH